MLAALGASALAKFLSTLLGTFAQPIADYFKNSDTQFARMFVAVLQADIDTKRAARDIVIAEQGWWVTAIVRPLFAYPLALWWGAVILDSIFLFDWEVAALPAPLDEWAGWIVAAYFVMRPVEKLGRSYMARK